MRALIFAKPSTRLPGKHLIDICGEPMILRIHKILDGCRFFDSIIIYSKYEDIWVPGLETIRDRSTGTLLDSLISALELYDEFFAIGGDMPYVECKTISMLISNYTGKPVTVSDSHGFLQPLFAIYNRSIYRELKEHSTHDKRIYPFLSKNFSVITLGPEDSETLLSINTEEDLNEARRRLRC
ncbi:MAG: NTP transferase domain-containing protein [Thermoplasmatales archaeon]